MKKALLGLTRLAGGKLALRVVVTVALLFLIFRTIDLSHVGTALSHAEPRYLALALILGIIANVVGALAWKPLLSALGLRLGMGEFARTYAVGLFFALFTPGGLGSDAIRTYEVKRITGRGMLGFGSIMISRILSLLALLLIGITISLVFLPSLSSTKIGLIAFSGCVVGTVALATGLLLWRRSHRRIRQRRLHEFFSRACDVLDALRERPRVIAVSLGLYLLHHGVVTMALFAGALSLGIGVPLQAMFALAPLARAAALLPLSINGLGVQESAFIILLGQIGVTPENAIALSVLGHLVLMPVPLLGGIVFLLLERRRVHAKTEQNSLERQKD